MGFFSGQVMQEGYTSMVVPDIKGYNDGFYSAKQAMIDSVMNEQSMFEGMILTDISESVMRINGAGEGELLAFAENVITDVLEKIKEFLMKVWEKIKAIFRGWMAKLDNVMGKSNKEFVNKYRKVVMSKDLTDMSVKWRKPKKGIGQIDEFTITGIGNKLDMNTHAKGNPQDILDKWDNDDELCTILKACVPVVKSLTDPKDFETEFIDEYFEDEDEDDKVGNEINGIMAELLAHKDQKKGWERANKSLEKAMSQMTKAIDKDVTEMSKAMPLKSDNTMTGTFKFKKYGVSGTKAGGYQSSRDDTDVVSNNDTIGGFTADQKVAGRTGEEAKTLVEKIRKSLLIVQKYANLYAQAANKYTSAVMKALKLQNDQNRKVWAAAVAYSRKEEAVMTEALMELAEYESDVVYNR